MTSRRLRDQTTMVPVEDAPPRRAPGEMLSSASSHNLSDALTAVCSIACLVSPVFWDAIPKKIPRDIFFFLLSFLPFKLFLFVFHSAGRGRPVVDPKQVRPGLRSKENGPRCRGK